MSIARDVVSRSIASRSASSTITNSPFETSQPRTISSGPTSRSCVGHQRFCLIGVLHSRCRSRKDTSDWRAAGFVAGASPTGIVTSPKLIAPFQVVRIDKSLVGDVRSSFPTPRSLQHFLMNAQQRTIVRLWRDAVASGRPDPLYLAEGDGEWTPVPLAEAARRVDELANGLLALGIRKGEAFGILAGTRVEWCLFDFALALVGGVTAPIYANSSPEDCRYVLEPLRRRRRARRGRGAAAERSRPCARELPGLRHVLTFADLEGMATRGREHASEQPRRSRAGRGRGRRGRPLHVHLHVGHDRAAEGLQDPPPQLLRDGEGRQRHGRRLPEGRPAAALSAARPQLRPPHASPRRRWPATRSPSAPTRTPSPMRCPRSGPRSSRACHASTRRCTRPSSPGSTRPPVPGGSSSTGRSTSGDE